jgi:hypothetical protein
MSHSGIRDRAARSGGAGDRRFLYGLENCDQLVDLLRREESLGTLRGDVCERRLV